MTWEGGVAGAEPPHEIAPNSYAVEVIADASGEWVGNGVRYKTRAEAEDAAKDLASRWMLVTDYRAVPSTDAPNR